MVLHGINNNNPYGFYLNSSKSNSERGEVIPQPEVVPKTETTESGDNNVMPYGELPGEFFKPLGLELTQNRPCPRFPEGGVHDPKFPGAISDYLDYVGSCA